MKNKVVFISYLFPATLVLVVSGCGNGGNGDEPRVERVLPPAENTTDAPGEGTVQNLAELEAMLETNPGDISTRFNYLVALRREGRTSDAIEQAIMLGDIEDDNPYRAVALMNLGQMVLEELDPGSAERAELLQSAIDGINECLVLDPGNVQAHLILGELSVETGDTDTAMHHLAIVLAANEIGIDLRIWMAEKYIDMGDPEKARSHLKAARILAEQEDNRDARAKIDQLLSELE